MPDLEWKKGQYYMCHGTIRKLCAHCTGLISSISCPTGSFFANVNPPLDGSLHDEKPVADAPHCLPETFAQCIRLSTAALLQARIFHLEDVREFGG